MLTTNRRWRVSLFLLVLVTLVAAIEGGLWRIGWRLPGPTTTHGRWALWHGALMVSGFLGTLISLERAVAIQRREAYLAPLLTGLGGVALVFGWSTLGSWLLVAGSLGLLLIMGMLLRWHPASFTTTMFVGAWFWFFGTLLWARGHPIPEVAWSWQAFLVLTIAGERLELGRLRQLTSRQQRLFILLVALYGLAVMSVPLRPDIAVRLAGGALFGLGWWLWRFDMARRTIRQSGLTRFIAASLLPGYLWLMVGGGLALAKGFQQGGVWYDATLHAIFLGFIFSMIFGHAPIILPAILSIPPAYHWRFYLHLGMLHLSLILRLGGDLLGMGAVRRWGGLLNGLAIVLFLLNTASLFLQRQARSATGSVSTLTR